MNTNSSNRTTAAAVCPRACPARRVVVAGGLTLIGKVIDQFRTHGWEVLTFETDHDVHAATAEAEPDAVVLPETGSDESGYLACAKLLVSQPELKVVVVGRERSAKRERFAEFVGATFVTEHDAPNDLVAAVA